MFGRTLGFCSGDAGVQVRPPPPRQKDEGFLKPPLASSAARSTQVHSLAATLPVTLLRSMQVWNNASLERRFR
jgi:hypothetical protein